MGITRSRTGLRLSFRTVSPVSAYSREATAEDVVYPPATKGRSTRRWLTVRVMVSRAGPPCIQAGRRGGSGGQGRRGTRQRAVGGTADGAPPPVHHVGTDHCGADIPVAQKLLDGADVVAVF